MATPSRVLRGFFLCGCIASQGLAAGLLLPDVDAPPVPLPPRCICAEQRYCSPLDTPPAEHEIFPFVIPSGLKTDNLTRDWFKTFRWDLVTTASWTIGANETICHAHAHGARVVAAFSLAVGANVGDSGAYMQLLYNKTARAAWIAGAVGAIDRLGADGITFDIEGGEGVPNNTATALTSFLSDVRAAGKVANPHFQLSFETPIYMGQPVCSHANDWAAMIRPNGGPVDFYVRLWSMNHDNGSGPPGESCKGVRRKRVAAVHPSNQAHVSLPGDTRVPHFCIIISIPACG
jgi:hypothetical protein